MSQRTLFHSLQFEDVDRAIVFLRAVGFTEAACFRDDSGAVVHAQYDWRDTGGVMFGSVTRDEDPDTGWARSAGHGQCYCVVESDERVDEVHAAAVAAGATSIRTPENPDYGGRTCAVRDAEGNQWSFGSYGGE
jgi:uncharacterized glyoxalase superfamily protein PhnB